MKQRVILSVGILLILIFFGALAYTLLNSAPKNTITFVYSNKVNYEPMIIATEKGYFEDEGLDIKVSTVVGGIQAAEAIATGSADAAAMGDAPAVMLMSKHLPVKVIARYGGGDKIHRLVSLRTITSPDDLEGKRIGLQLGSSTHGGFMLWASAHNLDISKINLVALNPLDMPDALNTGQIDAMAGSEPWPTNVETLCKDKVHELADFSGLGNSFPHVLVVTERLISKNPQAVEGLIRAIHRSVDYLKNNPDAASEITSKYIGLPKEIQKRCTNRLLWEIGWEDQDLQSMRITANFLKDFGKIEKVPDFDNFVDSHSIRKIK